MSRPRKEKKINSRTSSLPVSMSKRFIIWLNNPSHLSYRMLRNSWLNGPRRLLSCPQTHHHLLRSSTRCSCKPQSARPKRFFRIGKEWLTSVNKREDQLHLKYCFRKQKTSTNSMIPRFTMIMIFLFSWKSTTLKG